MIVIEIAPNPNCEAVDLRLFHELEPPRTVRQIRLERQPGHAQWYDVVGWSHDGTPQAALGQKVDDSGEGVAILIHGGDAGLRLRPCGSTSPWRLDHPHQFGLPFILTTDTSDLQFDEETA